MRLHAFEERKKALPAVESPVVTDDERVAEATVGRSTAVDAWTIFAQRRGKLRQRGRLPQSLEEEAATAVSVDVGEDDNRYMRMALRLAEQARMVGEVPVSCAPREFFRATMYATPEVATLSALVSTSK